MNAQVVTDGGKYYVLTADGVYHEISEQTLNYYILKRVSKL